MTIYDDLRSLLTLHGIDTTQYTDDKLDALILEAKLLINTDYTSDTCHQDYVQNHSGTMYMTEYYPVKEVTRITLNDEEIIPLKTRYTGLIYFNTHLQGTLQVEYVCGLTEQDYTDTILPICLCIAKDKDGQNISSISEGDVTVGYTGNSNVAMIDTLIANIRSKYGARVRLI